MSEERNIDVSPKWTKRNKQTNKKKKEKTKAKTEKKELEMETHPPCGSWKIDWHMHVYTYSRTHEHKSRQAKQNGVEKKHIPTIKQRGRADKFQYAQFSIPSK